MLIIVGIITGSFVLTVVDIEVEESNYVAIMMILLSLGIGIPTFLIGVVVGFSLISISKKFARIRKIKEVREEEDKKRGKGRRTEALYIQVYCFTLAFMCFVFIFAGSIDYILVAPLTLYMLGSIVSNYLQNTGNTKESKIKIGLGILLILIATSLAINNVSSLNIFILFYGFITVPNYILPNSTYQLDTKNNRNRGLCFSLTNGGAVANGIILAQALISKSEKDTIGTLINNYITDESRIFVIITILVVLHVYYSTKESKDYYKNAPKVISNNNSKVNKKFALLNIIVGATIAVTQFNPFVFIVITVLGIACAYLILDNDVLRSLCVPCLLMSGMLLG